MRRLGLLPLLACLALPGCGGNAGDAGADPAAHLPADAAFYFEVVVRPEGDQAEQMKALLGKVLQTGDPGKRVRELVDEALRSDGEDTSYEKDFEPWLGRRVGGAVTGIASDEPDYVIAFAARDADTAAEKIEQESESDRSEKATYEGTDYWVDKDGEAAGVAGDVLLVSNSEQQMRKAIDAVEGDSLADADRFKKAIDPLPEDREGLFYVDTKRLIDAAMTSGAGGAQLGVIGGLFGGNLPPTAGALLSDQDTIAIETIGSGPTSGPLAALTQGAETSTPLLGDLPGDAWGALAIPDLGRTAQTLVNTVGGAVGGALLQSQLEREYGINAEQDVFSWIGDTALYVRGDSLQEIEGAIVISVEDAERARDGITKLVGLAQQQGGPAFSPVDIQGADVAFRASQGELPKPLIVAVGGERAVIAVGEAAAADGLETPSERLADAEVFGKAKEELDGLEPSMIIDGTVVAELVRAAFANEEGFAEVEPYLKTIEVLASGAEKKGDDVRQRLALGVK